MVATMPEEPLLELSAAALDLLRKLWDASDHPREMQDCPDSPSLRVLVDAQCVRIVDDTYLSQSGTVMCQVDLLPLGRRMLRRPSKG